MTSKRPPSQAQKDRAARLRRQIKDIAIGNAPAAPAPSPREITDKAARDAANKAKSDEQGEDGD